MAECDRGGRREEARAHTTPLSRPTAHAGATKVSFSRRLHSNETCSCTDSPMSTIKKTPRASARGWRSECRKRRARRPSVDDLALRTARPEPRRGCWSDGMGQRMTSVCVVVVVRGGSWSARAENEDPLSRAGEAWGISLVRGKHAPAFQGRHSSIETAVAKSASENERSGLLSGERLCHWES